MFLFYNQNLRLEDIFLDLFAVTLLEFKYDKSKQYLKSEVMIF